MKKAAGPGTYGRAAKRFRRVQAAGLKLAPRFPNRQPSRRSGKRARRRPRRWRMPPGRSDRRARFRRPEHRETQSGSPRDQRPDMIARSDQPFRQMASQQTRCPRDQNAAAAQRRAGHAWSWLIQSLRPRLQGCAANRSHRATAPSDRQGYFAPGDLAPATSLAQPLIPCKLTPQPLKRSQSHGNEREPGSP